MQELKEALRTYLRGESAFESVRTALDTALARLPAKRRGDVEKLLKAAHSAGLQDADFVALASRARSFAEQPLQDKPAEKAQPDFLSTVVLPKTPAAEPEPVADDASGSEFLETVVLPGGAADATRARADAAKPGADPDATVFAGSDAAAKRAADADTDVRAGSDDDATVMVNYSERTDLGALKDTPPRVRDDGDTTDIGTGAGNATDDGDDATVMVNYSERTDLGALKDAPSAGGDDVDTTDIGRGAGNATGDGDDATVMNAGADETATAIDARLDDDVTAGDADDATAINAALDADDATAINAALDADDVTAMKTRGGDDATAINVAGQDDDATAVNAPGGDPDRTEVVGEQDAGFDIFADENLAAAEGARERSGGSWPTGAPTSAPTGAPTSGAGIDRDYGAGDRIRDRFELLSKLGEGGMGAVWKAKDLLKEEARDRNPFVAMKLLQGDFKSHPESFIALQRETAKQQRLAHPNIATVYDFDRDAATGTVFMTMEVMEGQPLDAFVRKLPTDGLTPEEAMPLIEQLCRGLQYAHDNGLVHSDLKPGNCFLIKDGTVKLLDFGIARASKTKTDAEGEATLFDPGQLGALTPTYATIEMFDGMDPDQRDDIYALAIISYQLLTGKHPFGKKSAPKARELKLEPAPIAKLNKAQNKALRRGLAFLREDRTPTVSDFLDGLTPRKSRTGLYVGGAVAALLIIAVLSYSPIVDELDNREREEVIAEFEVPGIETLRRIFARIQAEVDAEQRARLLADKRVVDAVVVHIARGDMQSITEGRELIAPLPTEFQRRVMDDERTRTAIVDYYEGLRLAAFDPAEKLYDFPAAQRAIDELKSIYTDSATAYRLDTELSTEKDTLLNELGNRYNNLLAAGMLIPDPDPEVEHIGDVLGDVRQIDPKNRLLQDDSLRFEFEKRVEQAMSENDYATAKRFLDASIAYAPDDPTLSDLRYQVDIELKRIADQQLVAEIQQRLRAEYPTFASLADFQRVRDDLIRLADLDPANPVLAEIQNSLKSAFGAELDKRIAAAAWNDTETLLVDYAKLLDIPYVTDKRGLLSAAEEKAGFTLEMTAERQAAVNERVERLRELIADPEFTSDWEIAFRVPYKELIALLPLGDPAIEPVRQATAQLYLDKARAAREADRFAEAVTFVDRGRTFYPGLASFDAEQQAVLAAQESLRKQREEQQRLARLERRKGEVLTAAQADDVDKATQILAELRAGLPADDPFLQQDAPQAIANSYLNLARLQADNKQFDNAVAFVRRGLEIHPEMAELQEVLRVYEAEVAKRAEQLAVGKLFDGVQPLKVAAVSERVKGVRTEFPDEWPSISRGWAQSRVDKLKKVQTRSAADVTTLTKRIDELKRLLPEAFEPLAKELGTLVGARLAPLDTSNEGALQALAAPVASARKLFADQMGDITNAVGSKAVERIKALEAAKERARARDMLALAKKVLPDSKPVKSMILKPIVVCALAPTGLEQVGTGALTAASATLQNMDRSQPDCIDAVGFKTAFQTRYAKAQTAYGQFAALIKARRKTEGCTSLKLAMAAWTDSPVFEKAKEKFCPIEVTGCHPGLAGHGAKTRGTCSDTLGDSGSESPTMVVVPVGDGAPAAFAIGKYEVTIGDFNTYCKLSGKCQARGGDPSLPITGVSLAEVEAYAAWLSKTTGETYRLPTDGEWLYAANAGGKLPSQSDYNCRVESGGQIIKGIGLVNARSGKPNGWGLINFVGNAQEWVKTGGSVKTRGGAFQDPLTRCGVDLSEPHGGGGDAVTGFRLVQELR